VEFVATVFLLLNISLNIEEILLRKLVTISLTNFLVPANIFVMDCTKLQRSVDVVDDCCWVCLISPFSVFVDLTLLDWAAFVELGLVLVGERSSQIINENKENIMTNNKIVLCEEIISHRSLLMANVVSRTK